MKKYVVLTEANLEQKFTGYIMLCANELPEYAQPVKYVFRDSLPLTTIE